MVKTLRKKQRESFLTNTVFTEKASMERVASLWRVGVQVCCLPVSVKRCKCVWAHGAVSVSPSVADCQCVLIFESYKDTVCI